MCRSHKINDLRLIPVTTVLCTETSMTVVVLKSPLINYTEDNLHLNDPACSLATMSNQSHLVAVMPLDGCGTKLEVP